MSIFAPDGKLARCLNCIGNLMILNILTLICCIPLVTAGAAMTALYTMTMRMARNEEGSIVREYFQAFRDNFKQATILWLIFGSLMVLTKNTAKNALLFCVSHFPQAILMLAVTICPLLLLSVSFRFISVVFLIGLSGPAYLAGIYFKSIFRRYETASAA